jgi:hypothetical protein
VSIFDKILIANRGEIAGRSLVFRCGELHKTLRTTPRNADWAITLDGATNAARGRLGPRDELRAELDGRLASHGGCVQ